MTACSISTQHSHPESTKSAYLDFCHFIALVSHQGLLMAQVLQTTFNTVDIHSGIKHKHSGGDREMGLSKSKNNSSVKQLHNTKYTDLWKHIPLHVGCF